MKDLSDRLKLSVLLVTYNHEAYIDRALQSLLKQNYPSTIEVVIADDASSDATLELIRSYEGRDPRFIFIFLDSDVNNGITKNYQRGFAACTGEYIAVLEGDDYWISPKKLSRQLSFLNEHWVCDLCAVNYFILDEDRATFTERIPVGTGHRFLGARNLIGDNLVGNFSTCMYRKSAVDALPRELFEICSYDWIVNICVASNSLIGFIEEPMSVYRIHSSGAWSSYRKIDKLKMQLNLIPAYDQLTHLRFHSDFARLKQDLHKTINSIHVTDLAKNMAPTVTNLAWVRELMPPIVIMIIRAIIPPIFVRMLLKIVGRGRRTS